MDVEKLASRVIAGDRLALARAITLVESTRADHRQMALTLGDALRASGRQALRIGLSGAPGVGKSTFIEAFGLMLVGMGLRVAVLAVDPSSARSGGSILGDKTRMERLSRSVQAFIRPSPSQTQLGGVARRTREAVAVCEAAGFDMILIETGGVGQSETMVADLCDVFVLLLAPAGGDELQGVKRGIMEMADLIVVNKADGDLAPAALRTEAEHAGALRLLRRREADPEGYPQAMHVSSLQGQGMEAVRAAISQLAAWRRDHGHWQARRAGQALRWFQTEVQAGLLAALTARPEVQAAMKAGERAVRDGSTSPDTAAATVLAQVSRG